MSGADGVVAEERSLRVTNAIATTHHAAHDSEEIAQCVKTAEFSSVRHISGNDFVATK